MTEQKEVDLIKLRKELIALRDEMMEADKFLVMIGEREIHELTVKAIEGMNNYLPILDRAIAERKE